jgi:hypothetical protein
MNDSTRPPFVNRASGAALAFVTVIVILLALTLAARLAVHAPAMDADRAAARYKALAEMRAVEDTTLSTPAWVDHDRHVVRLPLDTALRLAAQAWQNPEQARADLIARGEKASAPLPKVAPQPSAFE